MRGWFLFLGLLLVSGIQAQPARAEEKPPGATYYDFVEHVLKPRHDPRCKKCMYLCLFHDLKGRRDRDVASRVEAAMVDDHRTQLRLPDERKSKDCPGLCTQFLHEEYRKDLQWLIDLRAVGGGEEEMDPPARYVNRHTIGRALRASQDFKCSAKDHVPTPANNMVPFKGNDEWMDLDAFFSISAPGGAVRQTVPGARQRHSVPQSPVQQLGQWQRQLTDWVTGVGADFRSGKLQSQMWSDLKKLRPPSFKPPGAGPRLRPA
ncbi:MAG: hypothetical protein M1823_002793 [Watsoniomyces obsoletus]|nr:MAG: hypothetical protein M1823_002793 [Watsoniomyces obsoletus]